MNQYIFALFFTALCGLPSNGVSQKRDLYDEVLEQVETLRSTVQSSINVATDNVEDTVLNCQVKRNSSYADMEATLDETWLEVWSQMLQINEISVGYDVGACNQFKLDILLRMPQRCRDDANTCLQPFIDDLVNLLSVRITKIRAYIGQVDAIAYQVTECNSEILCLSPLETTIGNAMITIPQDVGVEVDEVMDLVNDIDVNNEKCIATSIDYMAANGYELVQSIAVCVNNVITCGSYYCL